MKKKMLVGISLLLAAIGLGVFGFMSKPEKIDIEAMMVEVSRPFSQQVDHKLRLAVVSRMTAEEKDNFYKMLQNEDEFGVLDYSVRPTNLDDSDVIVYLLRSWSDILEAPGQDSMDKIYKEVSEAEKDSIKKTTLWTLGDGRKVLFVFYNSSATPNSPLTCYAKDLLEGLYFRHSEKRVDLRSCSSQTI